MADYVTQAQASLASDDQNGAITYIGDAQQALNYAEYTYSIGPVPPQRFADADRLTKQALDLYGQGLQSMSDGVRDHE